MSANNTAQLKRDYLWNTLGVLLQNITPPLLILFVTRTNGIDDSGVFSFLMSIALLLWAFGVWGGRTFQVSDSRQEFQPIVYITARILLAIGMVAMAVVFAGIHSYTPDRTQILLCLVLYKALESIADSLYGVLQVNNRLYQAGISLTVKSLIGLAGFWIVTYLTNNLVLSSSVVLVAQLVVLMFFDIPITSKYIHRTDKSTKEVIVGSLRMLKKCWAIFAIIFVVMFTLNIPRYFLEIYHPSDMGYFGIIVMPMSLISLVMMFILQPIIRPLTVLVDRNKYRGFRQTVNKIFFTTLVFGAVVIVGGVVCGVPLMNYVFSVDFTNYYLVLIVALFGGVANALVSMYVNILTVLRKFKEQFFVILGTNIILTFLCYIWIAQTRALGAVSLYAVISFIQLLLLIVLYNRILRRMGA